jgi:hypothetical protein
LSCDNPTSILPDHRRWLDEPTVRVCGTTVSPNAQWMRQAARQLVDAGDGFALGKTHLILDRDTKYSDAFRQTLSSAGVKIVLCPPRVRNVTATLNGLCARSRKSV